MFALITSIRRRGRLPINRRARSFDVRGHCVIESAEMRDGVRSRSRFEFEPWIVPRKSAPPLDLTSLSGARDA
jgi:hypothetical protein